MTGWQGKDLADIDEWQLESALGIASKMLKFVGGHMFGG